MRRALAGRGIGRAMLHWAGERCAEAGRPFLRLDTMSVNMELRAYYERLGFQFRGLNPVPVWRPALYERPSAYQPPDPHAP
jgi:ribosomal protein S18 acetylase RimI-like enzyme